MNVKLGLVMGLLAVFGPAFAKESVFFVGAHPDDSEGFAATAFLLRETYDLHVIDLTRGERGLGPQGLKDGTTAKKRVAEEEAACAYLGATPHFLSEVNGWCCAGQKSVDQLVELLRQYRPKAVFTHWPMDRHSDHVQTAAVVCHALDEVRKELQPEFYYFEVMLHQTRNWHPIYSVDVTSTIENKLTMLRKYECQNDGDELAEANRKRAALRGSQREPRCSFAETFTTADGRPIKGGVLESLGSYVVTIGGAPFPSVLSGDSHW